MRAVRRTIAVVVVLLASLNFDLQPAQAHGDVCTGTWTMTTSADIYYPLVGGPTSTAFSLSGGSCVLTIGFSASGTLFSAWCNALGYGYGTSVNGHGFGLSWQGTLQFTGAIRGDLWVMPNAGGGESCVAGANHFVLIGTLVLHHGV